VGIWSRPFLPGSLRHCNATALTWSDAARQGVTRTSSNGIWRHDLGQFVTQEQLRALSENDEPVAGFSPADVATA
jgi:hypothetical protein